MYMLYGRIQNNTPFVHSHKLIYVMKGAYPGYLNHAYMEESILEF